MARVERYTAQEASGVIAGGAGYHGASMSNVYDDDVTLDESLAYLHVVNNGNKLAEQPWCFF